MKALEKDRARRYGAPSELAADIRRYLNREPVLARPASAAYRSGKFVKRHKLALAVASVFAVMALAGAVAIVREARDRSHAGGSRGASFRVVAQAY